MVNWAVRTSPCIFLQFPEASNRVLNTLERLAPSGATPLTQSVLQAARVLDYENKPGVVVLITDGQENCGGLPCQLAAEFAATAHKLTVHVIGFQVRGDFFSWQNQYSGTSQYSNGNTVARCLADQTGGHYVSTETVDELTAALQKRLGVRWWDRPVNRHTDRVTRPNQSFSFFRKMRGYFFKDAGVIGVEPLHFRFSEQGSHQSTADRWGQG